MKSIKKEVDKLFNKIRNEYGFDGNLLEDYADEISYLFDVINDYAKEKIDYEIKKHILKEAIDSFTKPEK